MLSKTSGFTFVELIIVMMLISVLAVGAYLNWPGKTLQLGGQISQIANDIRYAQSLSMSKDQRYRFVITSSTTYQITNSSGTAIILALGSSTITLGTGITFGSLTNLPNNLIAFGSDGTPYVDTASPGTALASAATIPITANGETRSVQISPQTGRVITQ